MTEPDSSRSRPQGAYDVFLSFRGEDTRKTFTDHLYTALVKAGIHTFRDDDELPRGEEISDHLLKAIQESKISIVVFSKGYASSRWCLDELVEILKCKYRKTGQIALPIFYDIDPSDVRKQTGSFAEAFVKHEERYKEKVKEWREALEEAGNLSGWNLKDMANGHEAKFIQYIIKEVWNKLYPKDMNVGTHPVGIDPLVNEIRDFVSKATEKVCIVGIHGMPGIGKTTIAKEVFNKLCDEFEGSSFLLNVKEKSESKDMVLLQQQLLHDILRQNAEKINNVDIGKVLIKERLRHKRVLVVFDDVDRPDRLLDLMGEPSWLGPGSRVIITTTDESLLLEADQRYQVQELNRGDSLQLFCRHAFRDTKPAKDYVELSNDVVEYCGGLPLALKVLGSCLYGKNQARWESVIDRLRKFPNSEIQKKLRISFDTLDESTLKNTFLDIACFFIGRKKEYVAKVLEGRYDYNPEDDFGTLIERSLIKVDDSGTIGMHDLLRGMGKEIVKEESPENPAQRSRIWSQEDAWIVLKMQMGTEVVKGLTLDVRRSEDKSLSTGSFTKMKLLKLLQINGAELTGSFKRLSKVLTWICWLECPLEFLPSDFSLDYVVVIDMQYSNIRELWKKKKMLNNLKILDLSYSKNLVKTPNMHSSSLEKLLLEGCSSLAKVHQSIGHSKSLVCLNISGCSQLKELPKCMGDIESFTELLADGINNEQFLFSVGHLKCVRKLSLRGHWKWDWNLPYRPSPNSSWISALLTPTSTIWRVLGKLKLVNCGFSERATNSIDFGGFSSLEELDLSKNEFFSLPSGIGILSKLRLLTVQQCGNLVSIPELPSNLEHLDTCGCKSMQWALCYGGYGYHMFFNRWYTFSHRDKFTMIPNWFSYRGKGSSLSFHIPPVFQGLVVGVVCQRLIGLFGAAKLCIKNKSNGLQLFEATVSDGVGRNWLRYISLSEMAMKEYCEDEELELCVGLYTGEDAEVFECGIHVIVEKTDSFEGSEWDHESEVGRDRVIPAPPYLSQYARYNFFEIYGKQGLSNLSKNTKDRLLERIFNYHFLEYCFPFKAFSVPYDYSIIPKWFSYSGEGCSLSFDIPPDFEGLVIWAVCSGGTWHQEFKAIIKNKSNGVQLFEATHAMPYFRRRWLRVISRCEMAMEKYCGDAALELHVILRSERSEVVRCAINVIDPFGRSNYDQTPALDHDIYNQESFEGSEGDHDIDYYKTSFEGSGSSDHEIDNQESEVESDRTIPSPPYHLLHHPHHGSMRFSTRQQWKAFLIRAFSLWKIITMQKFSPDDLN
ncbi:disease resistance protein RPV1-like [Populus nigra]|uniref:disease resistance protein RPV1-like n=1 Tax=Populus nigra TaxID=3691 RepID=UPI002B268952|nr:disease resistance protein RPV1-like [Populus nigra]